MTLSPEERWEQGVDHHPRSVAIGEALRRINMEHGWPMELDFGGDGDNGETLLYLLDIHFEEEDHHD